MYVCMYYTSLTLLLQKQVRGITRRAETAKEKLKGTDLEQVHTHKETKITTGTRARTHTHIHMSALIIYTYISMLY
jgi:hypothetical protein